MINSFLKSCGILFLSVAFLYSGASTCLGHDGHSDHETAARHTDTDGLVTHNDSHEPTVPVIHCPSQNPEVGPAAQIASTTIPRPDKASALHISYLSDAASAALKNDLWLDAVFRRIVTFPSPIGLARHLFLSVLQI